MSTRWRVLTNVAPGHPCRQSSFDPNAAVDLSDPHRAVAGPKTGELSFQTSLETDPWWEIDLEADLPLEAVVLYNFDTISFNPGISASELREGTRLVQVLTRTASRAWSIEYDHQDHGGQVFGGINSGPLVVWLGGRVARTVRVQLRGIGRLNLDGIEVFVEEAVDHSLAIRKTLEAANCHNFEIALRNLKALSLDSEELVAFTAPSRFMLSEVGLGFVIEFLLECGDVRSARTLAFEYRVAGVESARGYELFIRREIAAKDAPRALEIFQDLARHHPHYPRLDALHSEIKALAPSGPSDQIKLIIWDLDDTLWVGTLAEGDDVRLLDHRAQIVREARDRGIICSVVSKNDHEAAMAKLREYDLDGFFVFSQISFQPKGPVIKALIDKLRLRDRNCLFVDDNELNLAEANAFCSDLQTLNSASPEADDVLRGVIAVGNPDGGKRYEQYRLLESRDKALAVFSGDNEQFLRTCSIRIAIIQDARNMKFATRIEELVNRSNQLNFTKSRIPVGTASYLVGAPLEYDCRTVFARDRFGSYGLIGFVAIDRATGEFEHFVFSCRIMNMGIEHAVMDHLLRTSVRVRSLIEPMHVDYIEIVDHLADDFQDDFRDAGRGDSDIRVMANCQSGMLIHYLQDLGARCDPDAWPDVFSLSRGDPLDTRRSSPYSYRILGMFGQYAQQAWDEFSFEIFEKATATIFRDWQNQGARCFVLLPPDSDDAALEDTHGRPATYAELNARVRAVLADSPNISLIEIADFIRDLSEVSHDNRHFSRSVLRRVAIHLAQEIRQ